MGQGRDQAKQYLKEHKDVMTELRSKVLSSKGIGKALMAGPGEEGAAAEMDMDAEELVPAAASKKTPAKKTKH